MGRVLGPVFAFEWLMASRRWQMYALRSVFILFILGSIFCVWLAERDQQSNLSISRQAALGEKLFYAIISTQLSIVLLAAPAATAGTICNDKLRGGLAHLLVTDLSNVEIVLGKLAARMIPVAGMVLCTVPILFLSTIFGGIDPEALVGSLLVTFGVAVFGCVLALTLSVWAKKVYEVILVCYMAWLLLHLLWPIWRGIDLVAGSSTAPDWILMLNSFYIAFLPYLSPRSGSLENVFEFLAITLSLSALMVVISVLRIRAVVVRQMGSSESSKRLPFSVRIRKRFLGWIPGPSLERNPVLWREWQRKTSSRWVRVVWLLYSLLCIGFSIAAIYETWSNPARWSSGLPAIVSVPVKR